MDTSDKEVNSILSFLPKALLRNDSLVVAIASTLDATLIYHSDYWNNLDLDPMTCDPTLLDWIATNGSNPWRNLWQPDWDVGTKRLLLRDTQKIFQKKLFPETIMILFEHFDLESKLVPKSGLILGVTLLPGLIGSSILDYQVELPTIYKGTIEESYTKNITDNFGLPGYVPYIYV